MWGSSPAGWFGLRVSFSGSRSQAEFSVGSSVHRHRRSELQLLAWRANRNATGLTELISGWNTARLKSRLNTCRKSMMRLATRCPVGHTRVQNQNQNHSCTAHHTDLRNDPETKRLKVWSKLLSDGATVPPGGQQLQQQTQSIISLDFPSSWPDFLKKLINLYMRGKSICFPERPWTHRL